MTREEARKAAEVMLAYADGKKIEWSFRDEKDWEETNCPNFNWGSKNYRIKPEPKCRPFKDAEECWQEMQKHHPFGWVKRKGKNCYVQFTYIDTEKDGYTLEPYYSGLGMGALYRNFTFADGEPFGMKEEGV